MDLRNWHGLFARRFFAARPKLSADCSPSANLEHPDHTYGDRFRTESPKHRRHGYRCGIAL